jgi:nuclear cap-binding protein subunit 1
MLTIHLFSLTDDDDYDRRPQRRRYEDPLVVRVRKQLLAIAESPLKPVEEEISAIARLVCDNPEDGELQRGFVELVVQLAVEQPFKTPFVAAVVLHVNTLRSEVVGEIVTRVAERLGARIGEGEWREVKLLLKLVAGLQGVLEGEGVWSVLQDVFTKAIDLQTENSEEVSFFHFRFVELVEGVGEE